MAFLSKVTPRIQLSGDESQLKAYKYLFIFLTLTVSLVSCSYFSINPFVVETWFMEELPAPAVDHQGDIQPMTVSPTELLFDTIRYAKTSSQTFKVTNSSDSVVRITAIVSSSDKFVISSVYKFPLNLAQGQSVEVDVFFEPGSTLGVSRGTITLISGSSDFLSLHVYGLSTKGFEGENEPTLKDITTTLGYQINVGWTSLHTASTPALKGDEVDVQLFQKADTGNVRIIPVARYSPKEILPYGFYTKDQHTPIPVEVGVLSNLKEEHQALFPRQSKEGTFFDPASAPFGIYVNSNKFKRAIYTEDALNQAKIHHRARIYPLKNRRGQKIAHSYLICFEDASNGDYQDYVFVLSNVRPAGSARSEDTHTMLAAINAGGSEYTDANGQVWLADSYYTGGKKLSESFKIQGKDKDVLYLSNRSGKNFSYRIPLQSPGRITVRLLFLERDFGLPGGGANSPGKRIFNIDIENGQAVDPNFDINTWVTPGTTLIRSYENIVVNDHILNIDFTSVKGNAVISAIQVLDAD